MRIKRFLASNVHGYMNFDITFNHDLTYLTGINGSGKTTVLKCISAIISTSFATLAQIQYSSMEVELEHNGQLIHIRTDKGPEKIIFGCNGIDEVLEVEIINIEQEDYRKREEKEGDYYNQLETIHVNHPIMKMAKTLPTPMLLGIERRSGDIFGDEGYRITYFALRRRIRNIFGQPLGISLGEAIALAERNYHKIQAQHKEVADTLRENILLSSLKLEEDADFSLNITELLEKIPEQRQKVEKTFKEVGLPAERVEKQLNQFFPRLTRILEGMKVFEQDGGDLSGNEQIKKEIVFKFFMNNTQFNRLNDIIGYVDKYISAIQKDSARSFL